MGAVSDRNVERTIRSITAVPVSGHARRCRVFSERELDARFGREEDYRVVKIPRYFEADQYPKTLQPIEFGPGRPSITVRLLPPSRPSGRRCGRRRSRP
jgi:hypothetical protein